MNYQFEKYKLSIIDKEDFTYTIKLFPNIGLGLVNKNRKIYIIQTNNQVLYVGEAKNSILTRFRRGCNAFNYKVKNGKARNGYQGYKWLNKEDNPIRNLIVNVIIFNDFFDTKREYIEAIEGELVYLTRNKLGYWPKFQNEIHFSNYKEARLVAESIFKELKINE